MGSIEKKLSYLLGTKNAIKEAIASKGVNITDDHTFRDYADKIMEIRGKEYPIPSLPSKGGVDFYDYDGGILHTYTKEEFLSLSEMPSLPERLGLVCQGWNYSLEDAKAYVEEYGVLHIGAMYITDDGKTRFYISIPSKVVSEITLYFSLSTANSLVIDWGDGAKDAVSGTGDMNAVHKYEEVGDYVIAFDVTDGAIVQFKKQIFGSNRVYSNMVKRAEIGNGVTSIGSSAFYNCRALSSVVIPQGVTKIDSNAFNSCYSLLSMVIPQSVTSINTQAFSSCYFRSIIIPQSVTSISDSAFKSCSSILSVVIPQGVITIDTQLFQYCSVLSSVVIPQSVKIIRSQAFDSCSSLVILAFSKSTSVPTLSSLDVIPSLAELRIVVPDDLYDTWIAATNWSSYASRIVKASEFNA